MSIIMGCMVVVDQVVLVVWLFLLYAINPSVASRPGLFAVPAPSADLTRQHRSNSWMSCNLMVLQILQWLLGVVVVVCFCFTPVLAAAMLSFSCS